MAHNAAAEPDLQVHGPGLSTYIAVYVALLVLMVATIWAAHVNLGPFNVPVALSIASIKTLLVATFFMHLRYSPRLTWVVACGALVWLAILLTTYGDYLSRNWVEHRVSADPTEIPIDRLDDSPRLR